MQLLLLVNPAGLRLRVAAAGGAYTAALYQLALALSLPLLPPQAKAVGDQLVVGLIPDSEILRCKGPPVLDERERLALVQSVKWVDEVITGGQRANLVQARFVSHFPRGAPGQVMQCSSVWC